MKDLNKIRQQYQNADGTLSVDQNDPRFRAALRELDYDLLERGHADLAAAQVDLTPVMREARALRDRLMIRGVLMLLAGLAIGYLAGVWAARLGTM